MEWHVTKSLLAVWMDDSLDVACGMKEGIWERLMNFASFFLQMALAWQVVY